MALKKNIEEVVVMTTTEEVALVMEAPNFIFIFIPDTDCHLRE